MKFKLKKGTLAVVVILLVIGLFILASYFTKTYTSQLSNFIEKYYLIGMFVYISLGVIDAVGVPITNVPLIPVVVGIYGFYLGVLLTSAGWFLGSLLAFFIARKYGVSFIKKIISVNKIESIKKYIPKKKFFASLIVSRLLLPNELINYGYGIFTDVEFKTFAIASLIGIILTSIALAYIDTLSLIYEVLAIILGIFLFAVFIYFYSKKSN